MAYPKPYAPVTLRRLYRQLDLPEQTTDLLHRYLSAMSQFYLIMPLSAAYAIITGQNPDLSLSEEQFDQFASIVRREEQPYRISGYEEFYRDRQPAKGLERLIVSKTLCGPYGNMNRFKGVDQHLSNKYYCVLDRDELLCYEDPKYRRVLPEESAFRQKMADRGAPSGQVDALIDRLYTECRPSPIRPDILVEWVGKEIRDHLDPSNQWPQEQMEEALTLACTMLDAWPNPLNGGYSPREYQREAAERQSHQRSREHLGQAFEDGMKSIDLLGSLLAAESLTEAQFDEMIDEIVQAMPKKELEENREFFDAVKNPDFRELLQEELHERQAYPERSGRTGGGKPMPARSKKVGRNEPCPCGSGKKYKNCCGRPKRFHS